MHIEEKTVKEMTFQLCVFFIWKTSLAREFFLLVLYWNLFGRIVTPMFSNRRKVMVTEIIDTSELNHRYADNLLCWALIMNMTSCLSVLYWLSHSLETTLYSLFKVSIFIHIHLYIGHSSILNGANRKLV